MFPIKSFLKKLEAHYITKECFELLLLKYIKETDYFHSPLSKIK